MTAIRTLSWFVPREFSGAIATHANEPVAGFRLDYIDSETNRFNLRSDWSYYAAINRGRHLRFGAGTGTLRDLYLDVKLPLPTVREDVWFSPPAWHWFLGTLHTLKLHGFK